MALLLVCGVRGGLLATVDFILTVGQYQCFRHGTVMQKHQSRKSSALTVFVGFFSLCFSDLSGGLQ